MNFTPPAPPERSIRKKPLLVTVIVVSWCLIAASATAIFLNLGDPAETDIAEGDEASAEATEEAEDDGPLAAELDRLSAAFADDDRDAWMAMFGDETADLGGRYFDNLQALGAEPVEFRTIGDITESGAGTRRSYQTRLGMSFCLRPDDTENCNRSEVDYHVMWGSGDGGFVIDQFMDVDTGFYRPHPWEDTDLTVAVGERVTVAASADAGVDPADYLDVAESAAENADQYALLAPVDSYLVVLATDEQFNTWYGGYENNVALGNAPSTVTDVEANEIAGPVHAMMPFERHDMSSFEGTVRHELGHAATLQGSNLDAIENQESWWMMEGIAEYISYGEQMPSHRVSDTQSLVADGGCTDGIEAQTATDSASVASGKYGCAYLAVRYLVGEYGAEAFLNWFQAIHHEGGPPGPATEEHLGTDYTDLLSDITTYIEGAA